MFALCENRVCSLICFVRGISGPLPWSSPFLPLADTVHPSLRYRPWGCVYPTDIGHWAATSVARSAGVGTLKGPLVPNQFVNHVRK